MQVIDSQSTAAGTHRTAPVICDEPAAKPKRIEDLMREACAVRHYSRRTFQAYWHWSKRFILWSGKRHPRDMGQVEVADFLTWLATAKQVSASTQRQALHGILFMYQAALGIEIGWAMGGPQHIVALALRTAWLCVRRSVEVRALTRDQITPAGIVWTAAKRQRGQAVKTALIEWSPALKATIDEALTIKRNKLAGAWYLFGNLDGQKYTKGGWKATLARLMVRCTEVAKDRKIAFQAFSLQDCRPKGVTDKMARGDLDVTDAAMHSSERMVRQVYDRRRVRVAKPAG